MISRGNYHALRPWDRIHGRQKTPVLICAYISENLDKIGLNNEHTKTPFLYNISDDLSINIKGQILGDHFHLESKS